MVPPGWEEEEETGGPWRRAATFFNPPLVVVFGRVRGAGGWGDRCGRASA